MQPHSAAETPVLREPPAHVPDRNAARAAADGLKIMIRRLPDGFHEREQDRSHAVAPGDVRRAAFRETAVAGGKQIPQTDRVEIIGVSGQRDKLHAVRLGLIHPEKWQSGLWHDDDRRNFAHGTDAQKGARRVSGGRHDEAAPLAVRNAGADRRRFQFLERASRHECAALRPIAAQDEEESLKAETAANLLAVNDGRAGRVRQNAAHRQPLRKAKHAGQIRADFETLVGVLRPQQSRGVGFRAGQQKAGRRVVMRFAAHWAEQRIMMGNHLVHRMI